MRPGAQGTPGEWLKRILDPTTIGVTPVPGSKLSRKLSVDYLRSTDPPTQIAVYLVPLDQLQSAAEHFAKTLHVDPTITGKDSALELHRFELRGEGTYPPAAEGLRIVITRSQFVDNKTKITLEYRP